MVGNEAFARRGPFRAAPPEEKARMEVAAQGFQWDEALNIVQRAEDTFNRCDVDAILNRYAEDVVIRFAGLPEIQGKAAAERFLRARFARQNNYRLKKTLFMVDGFKIGATYSASWEDARTGKPMLGRGAEFWRYRDGKLKLWDAAMTVWEAGVDPSAIFL
jgi:nuclear transport factor 2 (NTF2) superfamily protein